MGIEIPNFISKLNPKEFGKHLRQYSELYLNPLKSWKNAYSQRKKGYDFTVLHLIYYSLLVLLLFRDFYLTAQLVLLEVLVTFLPLLIFIIPFLISKKLYNIHKKWTKLFRVFLILKFQFIPPFVLLILFIKWSELELLYTFVENGIWVVWFGFLIVVPIINQISILKKLIWILMNYVFLLLGFFLIGLAFYFLDTEDTLSSKLQIKTPNQEYQDVMYKDSNSIYRINDKGYVAVLQTIDSVSFSINGLQFATFELSLLITQNSRNQTIRDLRVSDSLISIMNPNHVKTGITHKLDSVIELNNFILDSIREETNKYFYADLMLFDSVRSTSKFKSNRLFFDKYFQFLTHYESLFSDDKTSKEIISSLEPQSTFSFNNNEILVYYNLPEDYVYDEKKEMIQLKEKLEKRDIYSTLVMNIMFYPLDKILDLTGIY